MSAATTTDKTDYRTTGTGWANAWKIAAGVGALGLAGAGAGFAADAQRFRTRVINACICNSFLRTNDCILRYRVHTSAFFAV